MKRSDDSEREKRRKVSLVLFSQLVRQHTHTCRFVRSVCVCVQAAVACSLSLYQELFQACASPIAGVFHVFSPLYFFSFFFFILFYIGVRYSCVIARWQQENINLKNVTALWRLSPCCSVDKYSFGKHLQTSVLENVDRGEIIVTMNEIGEKNCNPTHHLQSSKKKKKSFQAQFYVRMIFTI